ncbi:hypothetical protein Y032_0011g1576 [Ancylostoma ceylanicum]|uniref:Uncharacterized protein n=1 Tax=Ancylostoma ceylanicum TaxID=53326 RepID=A0A016VFF6_9BILA|nr:hypothetical protein Y032_0011g1576 [Ancylostoma ceylanicum]
MQNDAKLYVRRNSAKIADAASRLLETLLPKMDVSFRPSELGSCTSVVTFINMVSSVENSSHLDGAMIASYSGSKRFHKGM